MQRKFGLIMIEQIDGKIRERQIFIKLCRDMEIYTILLHHIAVYS